jgi:ribosomal protein S16
MQGTVEKIHRQLEELLAEQRAKRTQTEQDATVLAEQVIADVMAMPDEQMDQSTDTTTEPSSEVKIVTDATTLPVTYARNAVVAHSSDQVEGRFAEVDLTLEGYAVDANSFFDVVYNPTLLRLIEHVVRVEGPVRDEVLARRIARAHGWVRTGAKIQDRVVRLASQHFRSDPEDVGTFFRAKGESADVQIQFRRPIDGTARSVDEISLAELRALAFDMMQAGHDEESGVPAMAREVGLRKLNAGSRMRLEMAWSNATKATSPDVDSQN